MMLSATAVFDCRDGINEVILCRVTSIHAVGSCGQIVQSSFLQTITILLPVNRESFRGLLANSQRPVMCVPFSDEYIFSGDFCLLFGEDRIVDLQERG